MDDPRILLVVADPLVRAALTRLFDDAVSLYVMRPVPDDWPDVVEEYRVDAVVWDVGWEPVLPLPDLSALDIPVLVLLPDSDSVTPAWQAGGRGLLARDTDAAAILAAIRALLQGVATIEPDWVGVLINEPTYSYDDVPALTPREQEVLQRLAEGLTNRAIAQTLAISDHTVKFHVTSIMQKLNAQSRTEAVVRATQLGLILL